MKSKVIATGAARPAAPIASHSFHMPVVREIPLVRVDAGAKGGW